MNEAILNPEARIESRSLADDGVIPNNVLPVVIYTGLWVAFENISGSALRSLLTTNGWSGFWVNGIYPYHHYHSTAHELLVVLNGTARVQLGGEQGFILEAAPGHGIALPAGVGHRNLGASLDFEVLGAYPRGQDWDLCDARLDERPRVDRNIGAVPLPEADPFYGPGGPLLKAWRL